jgi:phenylacetic acid degradation operon negative regulatory protein
VYYFEVLDPQDVSARALVLSLMSSTEASPQAIGRLINAAALFGIEAATLRVAVTRLMKDGLLESAERGIYNPGSKAQALMRRVQQWEHVAGRMVDWNGDWLVALTKHLGRSDRKQLRARERALALYGYQQTEEGFWVRPANLSGGLEAHRTDLTDIGADEDIILMRASDITMARPQDWASLWSPEALSQSYAHAIDTMEASLARLDGLDVDDAARETLLIGQPVIRAINFDPLLPPQLGDQKGFLEMADKMLEYNRVGQACWQKYYVSLEKTAQD